VTFPVGGDHSYLPPDGELGSLWIGPIAVTAYVVGFSSLAQLPKEMQP
jgi:hypothetical protein